VLFNQNAEKMDKIKQKLALQSFALYFIESFKEEVGKSVLF